MIKELAQYGHLYQHIIKRGQLGLSHMPENEVKNVAK